MYLLWVNPANFNAVTHYWYCSQISFPWHLNYVQKIRKDVKDYINSTGKSFSQLLVEAIQVYYIFLHNMNLYYNIYLSICKIFQI